MADTLQYGYKHGKRLIRRFPVDSATADISVGDLLEWGTAGYVQQAGAGDLPMGVAVEAVASPSSDGDVYISVDVSEEAIFAYPPDAGSVTAGLVGKTCDIGGAQSLNIDASTDDCIEIVGVDTVANLAFCRVLTSVARTGVV